MTPKAPGGAGFTALRRLPGYSALRFLYHCVKSERSRALALLRLRHPAGLFQPYDTTSIDRYPRAFRFVRDTIDDGMDHRLLSFGCSTGEEVFSLRRYFPVATIKGIDINPRNIRVCQAERVRRGDDPRLSFTLAGSAAGEADAFYDAVFAMAVFRHGDLGDRPERCDHRLHFVNFEHVIGELARSLKPDGLLAIRHANFRFSDTVSAAGFERVFSFPASLEGQSSPVYGPDNCRLPDVMRDDGIFRKRNRLPNRP
jgi:SAM-dependent methyltransferase